jgi:methylthioribose-1-phosphate isomerase
MKNIRAIEFKDDKLHLIDQTKLPFELNYIITDDYNRVALAIERLEVRGAPAIGVAAAYALALSLKYSKENIYDIFYSAYERLKNTRPTAVNLFSALDEIKLVFEQKKNEENLFETLISKAIIIHNRDIEMCDAIGKNGIQIFSKKSRVLTHCNTGALATGGDGTALNVIRNSFQNGLIEIVYVDETRPLFQGSRLTAWELDQLEIPFEIITDSTAASLLQNKKVDLIITGADRITLNGDVANKIGTYNLAVLAHFHEIPFYVAAPTTTIDKSTLTGKKIEIELRSKKEIFEINGQRITRDNYESFSPAFDVSPNELITAIITEKSIHYQPFNFKDV